MLDQLTALDATFLELEQLDEGATMHIGSVMVFEPVPNGQVPTLQDICENIAPRLTSLPRYSQRLSSQRTGGLSWPHWEDDAQFDVANHVQRAALPAPGGEAELTEWAADFFTSPRPHASTVGDGASGGTRGGSLGAGREDPPLPRGRGRFSRRRPRTTRPRADAGAAQRPRAAPRSQAKLTGQLDATPARDDRRPRAHGHPAGAHASLHPRETLKRSRSLAELIVRDELIGAPSTSINAPIGATRRYGVVRAPLAELKAIGRVFDGSLNDVILAGCASGLRELLLSRSETPPAQGLRAMVPMNLRSGSEQLALGNRISSLFVDLPVAEPDAYARLRMIIEHTATLKASSAALGASTMIDLASLAPPLLHASLARSLYATRLFNLTITNVPGPRVALDAFGALLREALPIVPLAAQHSLGIAIVSYGGNLTIGISADRDSTHDLDVLIDGVQEGFAELRGLLPKQASQPTRARHSARVSR